MPPSAVPDLSPDELRRYARHLSLPELGLEGQRRLKRASVLVIGAGGLGSPAALYLAAAGIGRLGIVDGDRVDASNLQRQVLHGTSAVGRPKVWSAAARLADLNPFVAIEPHELVLDGRNARDLLARYDVIVDGTDNFATRYVANDACVSLGRPYVYASIHRFEGQASVLATGDAPCYRCLFPEPPPAGTVPSCAEAGVLGVLPGLLGTIQAAEAIKLLTGVGDTLAGRLLLVDARRMRFETITLARDPECPCCGADASRARSSGGDSSGDVPASGSRSADTSCGASMTRALPDDAGPPPLPDERPASAASAAAAHHHDPEATVHESDDETPELTPADVAERLRRGDDLALVDVREPWEHGIARIAGARLVPLNTLPSAVDTIDRERETVVLCHHGMRSAMAVEWLRAQGFARVWNMAGGIDRWSAEVDPAVPRY